MRRQINGGEQNNVASFQLTQPFRDNAFLFAGGIILITTLIFGWTTVYWMGRGSSETSAIWYGMITAGVLGTMMQLANMWRGRLLTLIFLALSRAGSSKAESAQDSDEQGSDEQDSDEQNNEEASIDTEELLKGITCWCKLDGQAVGVCHHCGRFVCKKCGDLRPDKRFTMPGKSIYEREEAWHCSRCVNDYHANEWPRIRLFKS